MKTVGVAIRLFLVMTLLTGIIYPLGMTGIGAVIFHEKASGSLVYGEDGSVKGSQLLGQTFESETYFWPRPSAVDYNPLPSGGTNLSVTNPTLLKQVDERRHHLIQTADDATASDHIPADLVLASGSGLDPHIRPEAAMFQIPRIVKARHLDLEGKKRLERLVQAIQEPRQWGVLGEPRINVLRLNMEMDKVLK